MYLEVNDVATFLRDISRTTDLIEVKTNHFRLTSVIMHSSVLIYGGRRPIEGSCIGSKGREA